MAAWPSGNVVVYINKVMLCWAHLFWDGWLFMGMSS